MLLLKIPGQEPPNTDCQEKESPSEGSGFLLPQGRVPCHSDPRIAICVLLLGVSIQAQAPQGTPKPDPEPSGSRISSTTVCNISITLIEPAVRGLLCSIVVPPGRLKAKEGSKINSSMTCKALIPSYAHALSSYPKLLLPVWNLAMMARFAAGPQR